MSDIEDGEEEAVEEPQKIETKRIFINNVDTYHGKNLAKFLSKCVVGSSLEASGEEEAAGEEEKEKKKENTYKIYGTIKNESDYKKSEFVTETIKYETKEQLLEQLLECDIIIYDIIEDTVQVDEACWAITSLHNELEKIDKPKLFILLSTVMTWAKSKPTDPEDPDVPFTEEDFRKRKCHPNFREHLAAEKTVLKFGKTNKKKLSTYIVCSGLVYGQEESLFHYLFKAGWHNEPELPVYGNGKNIIPAIHINDLGSVIQNIADQKPKIRYLLALDDSKFTLKQITKAVSKQLTTGKFKILPREDAFLNKEISQIQFDMLTLDLRMEAAYVKENMQIKWHCETGFVDNAAKVIKEFKISRNLTPFRVCILGPPGVGKTTIAQQLAKDYKVHHITIKDVITKAIADLEKIAARADQEPEKPAGEEGEEEEEEEDNDDEAQGIDAGELETIKESMEQNNGRLENQYIIRFFKQRLMSKPCQNQGFILDGFPKTEDQAKELFAPDETQEEEEEPETVQGEEEPKEPKFHKLITPDIIIKLDASDDFLSRRIMNLPEKLVQDTHNTEEGLQRRLTEYRMLNNDDETVTNVFEEEYELDIIKYSPEAIEDDKSYLHKNIVSAIKMNYMKDSRNYGLTPEEKDLLKRIEVEATLKKEREEKEERERKENEENEERIRKQIEWGERLEKIKKEELEHLETQSIPLRNYLMTHVMPTLTKGLIECAKSKPEDPIDFLAEFLFKNNPQIN